MFIMFLQFFLNFNKDQFYITHLPLTQYTFFVCILLLNKLFRTSFLVQLLLTCLEKKFRQPVSTRKHGFGEKKRKN